MWQRKLYYINLKIYFFFKHNINRALNFIYITSEESTNYRLQRKWKNDDWF